MKFEEWAEEWRASGLIHLRPSTARSYQYVLDRRVLPYFSGRAIVAIDRAEVKRFIAKALKEGRSVKTVREYLNVLSLVLQCALEAGAIKANPASRHKLPTRPKPDPVVLNLAQVEAVAAQIRGPVRHTRTTRRADGPSSGRVVWITGRSGRCAEAPAHGRRDSAADLR